MHFPSYYKEGLALCDDSLRLEKSQLSLLRIADRMAALREYNRLVVLATSIWLITSFFFQRQDVSILCCGLGMSCIAWLLCREGAKELEVDARMMIEGFKKRKEKTIR